MKKSIFLLLTFLLSACSPQVTVTSEVTVTLSSPTQIPTLIPTPTEIPLESLSIEELAKKYLAGEIDDINFLTREQRTVFSSALTEQINERAKEISYKNGEAFLHPETLQMVTGSENPEDLIFKPAYALKENADGTFSYTDQWGETHTIVGLSKDDEPMIITDAQELAEVIDLPQVDIMGSGDRAGMPFAQAWLAESYSGTVPEHKRDGSYSNDLVFLRHIKGEAYFDLNGKPTPRIILEFGKVIRDGSGKPILLYKFLATQEGSATLFYQEGMNSKMGVNFTTHQEYMANIPANQMAWLGTYGTELSSVFYYAPQNAVDWSSLELHTPEAVAFLQGGEIPNSKIPLIQAKVVIFESDQ